MNLVWHVVQKDVRRFRWSLAFFLFLAALPVLWGLLDAVYGSKDLHLHAAFLNLYFRSAWAQALAVILMAAILRGDENPSSTTAFWLTRPLSRITLLAAKALLMGLFLVGVPLLVQALVLALEGATAVEIAYADLELAFRLLESIVLAWLLASVTPQRWFLVAAAVVFPLQWLAGCWMLIWKTLNPQATPPFRATALVVSDSIVIGILTLLIGGALLVYQYRTRATLRTVKAGTAALALMFLIQPLWRMNLQLPSIPSHPGGAVSLALGKYSVSRRVNDWSDPQPVMQYHGEIKVEGAGENADIRPIWGMASLTLPDGKTVTNDGYDLNLYPGWFLDPQPRAVQALLKQVRVMNMDRIPDLDCPLLKLDPSTYEKFRAQPLPYRATVWLEKSGYQVEAEIPLAVGAGFRQDARSVTLLDVIPGQNSLKVKLQEQTLDLAFDHDPAFKRFYFFAADNVFYLLENKKRGEAYLAEPRSGHLAVDLHQAKQNLRLFQDTVEFHPDPAGRFKGPVLDKDWLKDAVLVRVRMNPEAYWPETLQTGRFSLTSTTQRIYPTRHLSLWYSLTTPFIEADAAPFPDWNALPNVQGEKLDSPSSILRFDDFEKGGPTNKFGAYWYDQCDKGNLGTTLQPFPFKPQPGGCPASPKFAAHIWGHFGKQQYPWPFANMGCGFEPGYAYVDLGNFSAVRFYTKGDNRPYLAMLERASITDYGYEQAGFTAPADWTQVTLPLDDFSQPAWAKPVPAGWADVRQLQFSPDPGVSSDEDFDLWVDQIELVK